MNNTDFLKIVENIAERAKVGLDTDKFNRFAEIDAEEWLSHCGDDVLSAEAAQLRLSGDEDGAINGMRPVRPSEIVREAGEK